MNTTVTADDDSTFEAVAESDDLSGDGTVGWIRIAGEDGGLVVGYEPDDDQTAADGNIRDALELDGWTIVTWTADSDGVRATVRRA